MLILGKESAPEPEFIVEFQTGTERINYIQKKFFNDLVLGQPFLLICRRITYDRHRLPKVMLEKQYFLGVLRENEPLFGHIEKKSGIPDSESFFIATRECLCKPAIFVDGVRKEHMQGRVEIPQTFDWWYTPVTKSFKPPIGTDFTHNVTDFNVEAFSLACGVTAMEELAANETTWRKDFLSWYACASQRLGINAESEVVLEEIRRGKMILITKLKAAHARGGKEKIELLLRQAKELGMDKDFEFVDIDGIRCQMAYVIQGFCENYKVSF